MDLDFLQSLDAISIVPLLLWMHIKGERRHDKQEAKIEEQRKEADQRFEQMAKSWEKQLAELNERSDEKEERLRDRYDQTIAKIDLEKKAQADKALEEIRALGVKVEDMTRFLSRPPAR